MICSTSEGNAAVGTDPYLLSGRVVEKNWDWKW